MESYDRQLYYSPIFNDYQESPHTSSRWCKHPYFSKIKPMKYPRALLALLVCLPPLFLPYGARGYYLRAVAFVAHAPFMLFGLLARALLKQLDVEMRDESR